MTIPTMNVLLLFSDMVTHFQFQKVIGLEQNASIRQGFHGITLGMMQDRGASDPQKSANCDQNVAFPPRPVVLIGMMGAGKTYLGGLLAARLGLAFTDSDAVIEADEGCSISDYFAKYGEAAFRALECRTFERLLSEKPRVIGAGGGAIVNPDTRALLMARAIPVWLQADVGTLAARCAKSDARPLLKTGDPATILATLLDKRAALYAEAAAFIVRTDTQSPEATIDIIVDGLKKTTT